MRNVREVDCYRAGVAFPQHQYKALRGKIAVFPFQDFRQIVISRDSIHQHTALAFGVGQLDNGDSQSRFNSGALLLPLLQRNAPVTKLPYCNAGIVLVAALAEQIGRHPRMVYEADTLKLVFRCSSAKGIEQERQQCQTSNKQIGCYSVFHCGLENGGNQLDVLHLFTQCGLLCGNVHSANKKKHKEEKLDRKIGGTAKLTKEVMPIGAALDFFLIFSCHGKAPPSAVYPCGTPSRSRYAAGKPATSPAQSVGPPYTVRPKRYWR